MEPKTQAAREGGTSGGGQSGGPTTVDVMDQEPKARQMIPVWFFVGIILLVYGVVIFVTGIYELSYPPSTVLAELHPAIWWGALLTVIGGVYVYLFMPRKS